MKRPLKVGDYVCASRWRDGKPQDPWRVGIIEEIVDNYVKVEGCGDLWKYARRISRKTGERILTTYPNYK